MCKKFRSEVSLTTKQRFRYCWFFKFCPPILTANFTNLFCRISTYFERKTIKDKLQIKYLVQLKDYDFENFDDKGENKVFEKLEFGGPSELTTERGNQYK